MLCWVDVETTGLDPDTGRLLELACLLTDDELNPMAGEGFQSVIKGGRNASDLWQLMEPVVFQMHARSGLLSLIYADAGEGLWEVEGRAMEWAQAAGIQPSAKIPLAGSSVHFDRAWLKRHMPRFEELFSYRNVDVSTVKELCNRWAPEVAATRVKEEPAHRAMADVLASIDELRWYRERFLRGAAVAP